jgi:hypothetical protein
MLAGCVKGSAAACVVVSLLGSVAVLVVWELRGRPPEETVLLAAPVAVRTAMAPSSQPSGDVAVFTRPTGGPGRIRLDRSARKTVRALPKGGDRTITFFDLNVSATPPANGPNRTPENPAATRVAGTGKDK